MTLNELYQEAKAKGRKQICRFMRDMKRAGIRMQVYRGRFWWKGPGVVVKNIHIPLHATKVKCQSDSMGKDVIVYPVESL